MSPEELARCAAALRELAANSAAFLDKQSPHFAELAEVRRQANRLIENLKRAVRSKRGQPANRKKGRNPRPPAPPATVPPSFALAVAGALGQESVSSAPPTTVPPSFAFPRRCYSCDRIIENRHAHYHWMCHACGEWNWRKREQRADLTGHVALVTGGRVRIGFQTNLKLLRAGARSHIITRFPHDAADRYQREPDWESWRERLTIHGLDLRDLASLQRFTALLARDPLDILINNAAQTIRPPQEFFSFMERREQLLHRQLAPSIREQLGSRTAPSLLPVHEKHPRPFADIEPFELVLRDFLDRRPINSWMSRLDDVAPVEAVEVHVINALAPFLLIQGLLPALRSSRRPRRFVINVSAREGRFAGKAESRHPHTNMAKAALNMLTRSLAPELRLQGIYINSVDPGWVSDQRPLEMAESARQENGDWLPLDDVDAAARLLDLVFLGVSSVEPPPSGRLWRNYQPGDW